MAAGGATADPVKDYLKQIGKVALFTAGQEVELAKRIEAGLFADHKLAEGSGVLLPGQSSDLERVAEDGRRAKNHLVEANLRLVVSLAFSTYCPRVTMATRDCSCGPGLDVRPGQAAARVTRSVAAGQAPACV